jgi:16S rRNA (uracil1498-N3)-methyltransferase
MQLFFHANLNDKFFELPEDESKHCIRVLRKKINDQITIIDGKGNKALCEIIDDNAKKCKLEIIEIIHFENNYKQGIYLAVAPTKNFDRMDWMIEKCTEIGISEITFIETENSERNKINIERCEKILIQAIKQSKQYWLPKINNIISYHGFIDNLKAEDYNCLLAWCMEEKISINSVFNENKPTLVMIGPEGDFTENEVKIALQKNFKPITLGNNILRTETAAIYTCSVLNYLYS